MQNDERRLPKTAFDAVAASARFLYSKEKKEPSSFEKDLIRSRFSVGGKNFFTFLNELKQEKIDALLSATFQDDSSGAIEKMRSDFSDWDSKDTDKKNEIAMALFDAIHLEEMITSEDDFRRTCIRHWLAVSLPLSEDDPRIDAMMTCHNQALYSTDFAMRAVSPDFDGAFRSGMSGSIGASRRFNAEYIKNAEGEIELILKTHPEIKLPQLGISAPMGEVNYVYQLNVNAGEKPAFELKELDCKNRVFEKLMTPDIASEERNKVGFALLRDCVMSCDDLQKKAKGIFQLIAAGRTMGVTIDLSGLDLRDLDLSSADSRNADLRGANLSGTDLTGANLTGVNLSSMVIDRHTKFKGVIVGTEIKCNNFNYEGKPIACSDSDSGFLHDFKTSYGQSRKKVRFFKESTPITIMLDDPHISVGSKVLAILSHAEDKTLFNNQNRTKTILDEILPKAEPTASLHH